MDKAKLEDLADMLEEMLEETGGPLSERERRAADQALGCVTAHDGMSARAAGQLCGATRTHDVIDAAVVLCARARGHAVLTSDPDDLRRLDPSLKTVRA